MHRPNFQPVIHPEKLKKNKSVGLKNEFLLDAKPLVGFPVEFPRCQRSIFELVGSHVYVGLRFFFAFWKVKDITKVIAKGDVYCIVSLTFGN